MEKLIGESILSKLTLDGSEGIVRNAADGIADWL
jgi:hypothetical protein